MAGQPGFFDLAERYSALSAAGDPLEKLTVAVDFDLFRKPLLRALRRSDRGKGGRPPYDPVLMWADTAYRSQRNETFLSKHGRVSMIHFRKPPRKSMPGPRKKANAARSKVRSGIEHVFAHQKGLMKLFVRTIGLARAKAKIGLVNLAYNMRRIVWLEGRTAPA